MTIAQTAAGLAGFAVAAQVAIMGADALVPEPPPTIKRLDLAQLSYSENAGFGRVTQQVVSESGAPVVALWAARLERQRGDGSMQVLCGGSGEGIYNGEISAWRLNEWTGDTRCPDAAKVDDRFEVAWTYQNQFGIYVTIGGIYRLTVDGRLAEVLPEKTGN